MTTIRERVFGPGAYYENNGGPVPIRALLARAVARRLEIAAHYLRVRSRPSGFREGHKLLWSVVKDVLYGRILPR